MIERDPIVAAGAVVMRRRKGVGQVLLVHRPKYDDWSFPKGKLDPGEDPRSAAVREVLEETGARVRLGPSLTAQSYVVGNGTPRTKLVHYWTARVRGDFKASHYESERPLSPQRDAQAAAWVPELAAYGVTRLVSSSARRCWTTLAPYGVAVDREIEVTDHLSEAQATRERVMDEVEWLLGLETAAAMCSHRPVLPWVFDAIGIDEPPLDPAVAVAIHHRHGRIVAVERIRPHGV